MLTSNPYAAISGSLPEGFMKWYVALMILSVIVGTLWDVIHKGSAKYFFANLGKKAPREVSGGEVVAIAIKTGLIDVATSKEFCTQSAGSRTCSPCTASFFTW